jgi:multicomponent Na+:H+ antiporter subunit C
MPYALCFLLFMIGLYCAVVKKNIIKIVIGLAVMEYAANLFLIMLGYRFGGIAPILDKSYVKSAIGQVAPTEPIASFINSAVDPLPQALVLTAIVIGLGSTALMISMCIRIYEKYGTFDITEIRRLKG